jgi:hypothetical protein
MVVCVIGLGQTQACSFKVRVINHAGLSIRMSTSAAHVRFMDVLMLSNTRGKIDKMPKHMTIVYDVEDWSTDEIRAVSEKARYMSWGHVPYQRDALVTMLKDALDSVDRFCADEGSTQRDYEIYDNVVGTLKKLGELK